MIPRSTAYRLPGEMSACFSAFRRQLPGGGYGAPADALGPVAILEELRLQARAGEINNADASSLRQDVRLAFGSLGPETRRAIGAGLDLFLKIMGPLRLRIGDRDDAAFLEREAALILRCLGRPAVREAAFIDAWKSFRKPDRPPERCELRLLQLREVVEHAGVDWRQICDQLDAVLEDRRSAVAALDEEVSADGNETAGLPEQRRLALCDEMVGREPGRGERVVWFVIDHPAMPEPWVSLGPIDIFVGELWQDGLRAGGSLSTLRPDFTLPAELEDERGLRPGTDRLDLGNVLFARVVLTDVQPGAAARRAREVLESAIEFATAESAWRLYQGELIWSEDGGWWGSSLLSPGDVAALESPAHPAFEPTAEGFASLDATWVRRLARGDRAAAEAVRDARLSLAAAGQKEPLLAIALGTRPLERAVYAFDPGSEDRAAVAHAYLRPAWVRQMIYGELFDAALGGLEVARLKSHRGDLEPIELQIMRQEKPGRKLFSLVGFEQAVQDLLDFVDDEGTMADRLLRRAVDLLHDPSAAVRRIETLEARFERLLARSERQRNTTIHGHLPPPALVESSRAFLEALGATSVRDLFRHDTGEAREDLPLAREQAAFNRAKAALAEGDRLVAALFSEETTD